MPIMQCTSPHDAMVLACKLSGCQHLVCFIHNVEVHCWGSAGSARTYNAMPFACSSAAVHIMPHGLHADIKSQLLSLNQDVLFLFLELLRALVDAPTEHAQALSRVHLALNGMQHLTNLLRPRQVTVHTWHALNCECIRTISTRRPMGGRTRSARI